MNVKLHDASGAARGDPELAVADPHDVTRVKLSAAARLRLPVYPHRLSGQEGLDLSATVDHRRELQQLPEPDHLTSNRNLDH
jgi:hypothetical protein